MENYQINLTDADSNTDGKNLFIIKISQNEAILLGFDHRKQSFDLIQTISTEGGFPSNSEISSYSVEKYFYVGLEEGNLLFPSEMRLESSTSLEKVYENYNGKTIHSNQYLNYFEVPETELVLLQPIEDNFKNSFFQEKNLAHLVPAQGWLKYHLETYKDSDMTTVHLCFYETGFILTGIKNGNLQIHQFYNEIIEDNILYFIHFACSQAEINIVESLCYLSGSFNESLKEKIAGFFSNVFSQDLPMRFSYPTGLKIQSPELFPYILNACTV